MRRRFSLILENEASAWHVSENKQCARDRTRMNSTAVLQPTLSSIEEKKAKRDSFDEEYERHDRAILSGS